MIRENWDFELMEEAVNTVDCMNNDIRLAKVETVKYMGFTECWTTFRDKLLFFYKIEINGEAYRYSLEDAWKLCMIVFEERRNKYNDAKRRHASGN